VGEEDAVRVGVVDTVLAFVVVSGVRAGEGEDEPAGVGGASGGVEDAVDAVVVLVEEEDVWFVAVGIPTGVVQRDEDALVLELVSELLERFWII